MARKYGSKSVPRGAGISDKKCAPGVGTMQNSAEAIISPQHPPPLPWIQLTGALGIGVQ